MLTKLIGTLLIGGGLALGIGADEEPHPAATNAALDLPSKVTITCNTSCDYCIDTSHHVAWSGSSGIRTGYSHSCWSTSSCDISHEICSPALSSDLVDGARYAALGSSLVELAALQQAHPDRVLLNAERNAVQLTDCDGHLMATFPVSIKVLEHLQAQED